MIIELFILLCLGLSWIISTEMITLPLREFIMSRSTFFGSLISCSVCTSFWVGTILGIFFTPLFFLIDGIIVLAVMKIIEKLTNIII
jgi:hypothetical protein